MAGKKIPGPFQTGQSVLRSTTMRVSGDLQLDLELVRPGMVLVHHEGDVFEAKDLAAPHGEVDLGVADTARAEVLDAYFEALGAEYLHVPASLAQRHSAPVAP